MSKNKRSLSFARTDTGNAELITALFGEVLRYDHTQGRWLIWDKRRLRWNEDKANQFRTFAITAARRRRSSAARISDKAESEQEFGWALASENQSRLNAALEIAKSLSPISDPGNEWDADHWLFGVANGVLDLKTGKLREERPGDRITKHSPVFFLPDAQCLRFERFLREIFNNDMAVIDYIQRMVGYCLTGSVEEQCVFCWYGPGANGKTTLSLVLRYILGDYAVNLPFSALELKNRNSNDLVVLAGARLATAAETNEGVRLNEARIKVLTGGDPITARRLYHEAFTFQPTHKLVLAFNHKPIIADDSEGMWRRVRLNPFTRQFKPEEREKGLDDRLRTEAPGILAWAIRGCLLWQKEGLGEPPAVAEATAAYREESDHVGEFVEDCCQSEATAASGPLWRRYQSWAHENEEVCLSRQAFTERLERRGFRRGRGHGGTRIWIGLSLSNEGTETQSPAGLPKLPPDRDTVTQDDTVSDISSTTSERIEEFSESVSSRVTTSPVV